MTAEGTFEITCQARFEGMPVQLYDQLKYTCTYMTEPCWLKKSYECSETNISVTHEGPEESSACEDVRKCTKDIFWILNW